jgi:hypothetical protein
MQRKKAFHSLKEEPVPPVPAAYAGHFSAVQSEVQRMNDK